jgi:hypothetical protein
VFYQSTEPDDDPLGLKHVAVKLLHEAVLTAHTYQLLLMCSITEIILS